MKRPLNTPIGISKNSRGVKSSVKSAESDREEKADYISEHESAPEVGYVTYMPEVYKTTYG